MAAACFLSRLPAAQASCPIRKQVCEKECRNQSSYFPSSSGWTAVRRSLEIRQARLRDFGSRSECRLLASAIAEQAVGDTVAEEAVEYSGNDELIMYFEAAGSIEESKHPRIIAALEGLDGVSGVEIKTSPAGATVKCVKKTTIQATDVASGLVAALQAEGFRVTSLNLGFDNEDDEDDDAFYDYEAASEEGDSPAVDDEEMAGLSEKSPTETS